MIKRTNRWIVNGADLSLISDFELCFYSTPASLVFSLSLLSSEIKYLISRQADCWLAGQGCAPGHDLYLGCSSDPAEDQRRGEERGEERGECNQGINFSSSSFNWFLCLTPHCSLVLTSCSPKWGEMIINLYSPTNWVTSLHLTLVNLTRRWWGKSGQMWNM